MRKNVIVAIAVFAALLAYVLITQGGNRGRTTLKLPGVTKIEPADMQRIEITRPGERLILAREGSDWKILEPFAFPADKRKLDTLQRLLASARITDLIAEGTDRRADYGLNSATAVSLVVRGSQDRKLELTLGASNQGHTHTFVLVPGGRNIYQVLGDFPQVVDQPAAHWRSLQIFDVSPDAVQEVKITQGRQALVLKKTEIPVPVPAGTAQGVTPPPQPKRMVWKAEGHAQEPNEIKVNQILSTLSRLSAQGIRDEKPVLTQAPLAVVEFTTPEKTYRLEFLAYDKTGARYQVRTGGGDTVYEIADYQGKNILKKFADLR